MTSKKTKDIFSKLSIASQGAKSRFEIAIVLVSILPLLVLLHLHYQGLIVTNIPRAAVWITLALLGVIMCLGYALLIRYPRTIIRLRNYLRGIAEGEVPDLIDLAEKESDITAIEEYFNLIIGQMKHRIDIIQRQREKLIRAERNRVMTESLCTACHHMGQPATAITCYLRLIQQEKLSPNAAESLARCIDEADKMRDILNKLQQVNEYQTDVYCATESGDSKDTLNIIQIKGDQALKKHEPWQSLEAFRKTCADMEGSYPDGTVVQLNNRAVCLVKKQNEESPSRPVVQVVVDKTGNHPAQPVFIDLRSDQSLSINRAISVGDPIGG